MTKPMAARTSPAVTRLEWSSTRCVSLLAISLTHNECPNPNRSAKSDAYMYWPRSVSGRRPTPLTHTLRDVTLKELRRLEHLLRFPHFARVSLSVRDHEKRPRYAKSYYLPRHEWTLRQNVAPFPGEPRSQLYLSYRC